MPILGLFENKTKSKFFSATVPSQGTEVEEFTLPKDVTVKHVEARFYPGQQLDLQLNPRLRKQESEKTVDLVDYPGDKNHLEGDDDVVSLPTHVEANKEDVLEVKAENLDSNGNSYDYYLVMTLEER